MSSGRKLRLEPRLEFIPPLLGLLSEPKLGPYRQTEGRPIASNENVIYSIEPHDKIFLNTLFLGEENLRSFLTPNA